MAIFLKIAGVTAPAGLTPVKAFEEWVELLSFSWSVGSRQARAGSLREAWVPDLGPVTMRRQVDVFSRHLIEHTMTGKITTVDVHVTRTEDRTGSHLSFSTWRFEKAFVSDYALVGLTGDPATEEFSVRFSKIRYEHFAANNTGRVRRSGGSDFDLAAVKA